MDDSNDEATREGRGLTGTPTSDDTRPGTREELRVLLAEAGLGPNQTRVWLDSPTPYLSGLIPAEAIRDPATAARARHATRRLIARLGPRVPELVAVTAVRILEPGTRTVLLEFDDGARRAMDLAPYLWGPGFDDVRTSYEAFREFRVHGGAVAWPSGIELSPHLLYGESWPADDHPPGAEPGEL